MPKQNAINLKKLFGGVSNTFVEKPYGHVHSLYLSGEIGDAEEYNEWFELIRNASENDIINIHINSPGGQLYTAIQFLRVLAESNAQIIGSVEGLCASAATLIFLACEQQQITSHSAFMFHNYSGGTIGKGHEMHSQIDFEKKWIESLSRDVYRNFLTTSEIDSMLEGKDFWMTSDEVWERLQKRQKAFEAEVKRAEKEAAALMNAQAAPRAKKKSTKQQTTSTDQLLNG